MDEMNPAYENFLNNMSRLGRTPRETTRRVSASKFLGRDEHFNSVVVESNEDMKGKIENIRVSKINKNTLFGELLKKTKKKDFAA